jgi:hypothetical protein
MTDTKPSKPTEEIYTVDVDWENQRAKVTSAKHKTDYVVGKLRSQMFFQVTTTVGLVPKALSGKYSSLQTAIDAIIHYVQHSKESFAVRSERLHEERQLRKDAKSNSENSKQSG